MTELMDKVRTCAVVAATAIIGVGSLVAFGVFLWMGGFALLDLKLSSRQALAFDALLCLLFFAQHSGMIRRPFRAWLSGAIPAYYHGAIYTLASGVTLALLAVCWQPSRLDVAVLTGAAAWLVRLLLLSALAGIVWGVRVLGDLDLFGAGALLSRLRREPLPAAQLTIRGPYRFVRHPFYLSGIVAIWACPGLSADRLLLNVLFTLWIALGARLEERDLVAQFGDAYRDYQRRVPMLVPATVFAPASGRRKARTKIEAWVRTRTKSLPSFPSKA